MVSFEHLKEHLKRNDSLLLVELGDLGGALRLLLLLLLLLGLLLLSV